MRDIEDTVLASLEDIEFIRQKQKQRRNGDAFPASPTCFWSSDNFIILIDTYLVFCKSSSLEDFFSFKAYIERQKS